MQNIAFVPIKKTKSWHTYIWQMLCHPFQASQEIATWGTIRPGLAIVLILGLYLTIGCYISYQNHDYPPPAADLAVWIKTWGEFSMLPTINIPLEQYRLFMAIISLPVTFGAWMLMAGSARVLTLLFGRAATFDQYLNLFAFSFFPLWLLAGLCDSFYSGALNSFVTPALQNEYGPLLRGFFSTFPPLMYTVLFGLGGIYNGLAAYAAGQLRWWQATVTGFVTFAWPMLFVSTLYR